MMLIVSAIAQAKNVIAVADTDAYGLYTSNMYSSSYGCKIEQTGTSGNFQYLVDADGDGIEDADWINRPVWPGLERITRCLRLFFSTQFHSH